MAKKNKNIGSSFSTDNKKASVSYLKRGRKVAVVSSLEKVVELASLGYTHENFLNINGLVKDVANNLSLEELKELEASYRDLYTDSCDLVKLEATVSQIKSRLNLQ